MKYDILNRWTGAVQFTAEIECGDDAPMSIKVGFAVRVAVKAGAYLAGADLAGANLAGANLADANLAGANLGEGRFWVDGGTDRRGFRFHALVEGDAITIRAGCRRWATFAEARAHFGDDYRSNGDRTECLARLALMESQVEARRALMVKVA